MGGALGRLTGVRAPALGLGLALAVATLLVLRRRKIANAQDITEPVGESVKEPVKEPVKETVEEPEPKKGLAVEDCSKPPTLSQQTKEKPAAATGVKTKHSGSGSGKAPRSDKAKVPPQLVSAVGEADSVLDDAGEDMAQRWAKMNRTQRSALLKAQIQAFKADEQATELIFPFALNAKGRREVHQLAERERLGSKSVEIAGAKRDMKKIKITKGGYTPPIHWPEDDHEAASRALAAWPKGQKVQVALEAKTVYKGTLQIVRNNRHRAYVKVAGRADSDFPINVEWRRNRALDGDEVAIKLCRGKPDSRGRSDIEAQVVLVVARHCRTRVVGAIVTLKEFERLKWGLGAEAVLLQPIDSRFPYILLPPDLQPAPEARRNALFAVELALPWKREARFPSASSISMLGPMASLQTHLDAALVEFQLEESSPPPVVAAEVTKAVARALGEDTLAVGMEKPKSRLALFAATPNEKLEKFYQLGPGIPPASDIPMYAQTIPCTDTEAVAWFTARHHAVESTLLLHTGEAEPAREEEPAGETDSPPSSVNSPAPREGDEERLDYRQKCVFCIDPAGAKDLDDALHCEALPEGGFEVGIHIADLGHVIKPGSQLAKHAAALATTTYLPHTNFPMVPRELSEKVCSLRGGSDKRCFSVVVQLDKAGHVQKTPWFGKTLVKPRGKLSYEEAQRVIERADEPGARDSAAGSADELVMHSEAERVALAVVQLNMLAKRMRTARMQAAEGGGAIQSGRCDPDFRLREGKVVLEGGGGGGGGGGGSAAVGEEGQESHQLIEEFMLLANKLVAEKLLKAAPAHCLLRAHPPPRTSKLLDWCRLAYECGFKPPGAAALDESSCRTLAASVAEDLAHVVHVTTNRSQQAIERRTAAAVLLLQLQRCNHTSQYLCTNSRTEDEWYHYGLQMATYTHFTSPIRRYADLVVHWLLDALLKNEPFPLEPDQVQAVADTINVRARRATWAERHCNDICRARWIADHPAGCMETAVVLNTGEKWLELTVPRLGLNNIKLRYDRLGVTAAVWKPPGSAEAEVASTRLAGGRSSGVLLVTLSEAEGFDADFQSIRNAAADVYGYSLFARKFSSSLACPPQLQF